LTILEQLNFIEEEISLLNTHSFVELAYLQKNGRSLFHNLFVFENYPMEEHIGNRQSLQVTIRGTAEFDHTLAIVAYEKQGCLVIILQYDEQYLETDKAIRLLSQFQRILA
ncbi:hypothetical protein, partial [Legionella oakridgensis]|uniref:hypothetical protein n=1 Tax=Legionella oakridgensis TaxID=29423 RepID=UPI00056656F9